MGRVFKATDSIFVDASESHRKGAQYKVSLGYEEWTEEEKYVIKVQMVYAGKISGRKTHHIQWTARTRTRSTRLY